jgi:hypothetical protein
MVLQEDLMEKDRKEGTDSERTEQDRAWHAGERGMNRDPRVQQDGGVPDPRSSEHGADAPNVETGVTDRQAQGASGHEGANDADREPAEGRRDI